jgi:large subunit ribosomal protein L32e
MGEIKKLLELRKVAKKRKPNFVVKESHTKPKVKSRWRFPRGRHSQVRQMHKGKPILPQVGFGSPRAVKGLDLLGMEPVLVKSKKALLALDKEKQSARISGNLGNKKKLELLDLAIKEKIILVNIKDAKALIQKIQDNLAARKKAKEHKAKVKDKKQQEKEKASKKKEEEKKKAEEKKSLEESVKDTEEKKEKEKKEIEKTITKPQK